MIDTITEGTRIVTEFQKPTRMPLQFRPVQALDQALTQASVVGCEGTASSWPSRISVIGFSEVTIIT